MDLLLTHMYFAFGSHEPHLYKNLHTNIFKLYNILILYRLCMLHVNVPNTGKTEFSAKENLSFNNTQQ